MTTKSQSPSKNKKQKTDQTHKQQEPHTPARRISFLSSSKKAPKDTPSSSSKTPPIGRRIVTRYGGAPPLSAGEQSGSTKLKANQWAGPCGVAGCRMALLAPTHMCKMCNTVVHSSCAIRGGGKGDSSIFYCSHSCKEKKKRSTRVEPSHEPGHCSIDGCQYPVQSPSHACKTCGGGVHNLCAQFFNSGPLKGGGVADSNIFYCSPACMEKGESHAAP